MRVLIIEDSVSLTDALSAVLAREKYKVDIAHDGLEGLSYADTGVYDVIILDVMMPKMDGREVLRRMRTKKINTPVIMLTALSQESDKIEGLDSGADDYLTKPFSMPELLARIRAVVRRKGEPQSGNTLSHLDVVLNLSTYELSRGEKSVKLSRKEYEIVQLFFEQPTFVQQRAMLLNKVWGFDSEIDSNNLEVFMSFIRKKLLYLDAPFTVTPVRGVGYRLKTSECDEG